MDTVPMGNIQITPSALTRHSYTHKNLEFGCDQCGKKFAFESDRDLPMNTHRTIKSFTCANPNCGQSYFSKGELDKHVKTHENMFWKCSLCQYQNADEWNLKAHMRVHSGLKKYLHANMCKTCLKLFKYDTQLQCHLPCKGKSENDTKGADNQGGSSKGTTELKRSNIPDY